MDYGAVGVIALRKVFSPGYSALYPIDTLLQPDALRLPVPVAIPEGVLTGYFASAKSGACGPFQSPFSLLTLGDSNPLGLADIPDVLASVACGSEHLQMGMGPAPEVSTPPPLLIPRAGRFRFRAGLSGTSPQSISVWVMQASNATPRPKMVVLANAEAGVVANVTVVASSSATWVEMVASVEFTVPNCAVWVELWNCQRNSDPAYFGRLNEA